MAEIHVEPAGEATYRVTLEEGDDAARYEVSVTPEERERYGGGASAETLIEESFHFLLEREPKEAILPSFGLSVIERYFPEYPAEIQRRLRTR